MPKPVLQALILADHVYEDKLTGKKIIAGIFSRIIRGKKISRPLTPAEMAPQPVQPSGEAGGGGSGSGGAEAGGGDNPDRVSEPQPPPPEQRVLEIPATGMQAGSPFAYISLTEVRGANNFILQLINLDDNMSLFHSQLRVECHNPLMTVELTVPLPPISPPQAGIYALELLHNNEILGSLRIVVEDAAN